MSNDISKYYGASRDFSATANLPVCHFIREDCQSAPGTVQ